MAAPRSRLSARAAPRLWTSREMTASARAAKAARGCARLLVLTLFLPLLVPSTAAAGNGDSVPIGDDAALTSAAVTATVRGGSALYYNPAGLMGAQQGTVDAAGSLFVLRRYNAPNLLVTRGGTPGDGNILEFAAVPSSLGYVLPLNSGLRVAVGIFQIGGRDFLLRSNVAVPRGVDGETSWALTVDESTATYLGSAGISGSPNDRIWIGAALHAAYATSSSSLQFAGQSASGLSAPDAFIQDSAIGSYTAIGIGANIGIEAILHDRVRLGASIFSPLLNFYETVSGSTVQAEAGTAQVPLDMPAFAANMTRTSRWYADLVAPARFRAGVAVMLDRGHIALDGDFQHGIDRQEVGLERRPVWNLRLGTRFHVARRTELGGGLFTDRSPQPNVRRFGETQVHFYGLSAGARWGRDRRLAEGQDASALHFRTTIAIRYAHGRGRIGGLDVEEDFAGPMPVIETSVPLRVNELGLHIGSELSF